MVFLLQNKHLIRLRHQPAQERSQNHHIITCSGFLTMWLEGYIYETLISLRRTSSSLNRYINFGWVMIRNHQPALQHHYPSRTHQMMVETTPAIRYLPCFRIASSLFDVIFRCHCNRRKRLLFVWRPGMFNVVWINFTFTYNRKLACWPSCT